MTSSATDRRCYPRAAARGAIQAWVFLDDGGIARCRVMDFSRSGVLLDYPEILLPGKRLRIALAFKHGSQVTRLVRRVTKVTRWDATGIAVVFVKTPRNTSERWRNTTS